MNNPFSGKPAADSQIKCLRKRAPSGIRYCAWFIVLLFANFSASSAAQSPCPGIHVRILNIRNSTGTVACALFASREGFPAEYLRFATNIMVIKVKDQHALCDFQNIDPGTYALVVVHDENMNGKLDTQWVRCPHARRHRACPG